METETNKHGLPLPSLTFRKEISDEKLRELAAPAEFVAIERGSWLCYLRFYSEENAADIDERIKTWFTNWHKEKMKLHLAEGDRKYRESVEEYYKNRPPGIPALRTRRGKLNQEGYMYLDDNDQWIYVFPKEDTILK